MRRARLIIVAILGALTIPLSSAYAQVLLHDDFNGNSLDAALWRIPDPGPASFLGRTQLRVSTLPDVSGGVARLRLDSHNPTALTPGDSFFGSEIITRQLFDRNVKISAEARM